MEGFEMSLLNCRLAETFKSAIKPFFVPIEGRSPRMIRAGNLRISFKGSVNKYCFGPIKMRMTNVYVVTTEAEKLLDDVKHQLGLILDENIRRHLGDKLGKNRPLLKVSGSVDQHNLRISCSISKKSFAVTQMQF